MTIGELMEFIQAVGAKDDAEINILVVDSYRDLTVADYRQDSEGGSLLILESSNDE